MTNRKFAIRVKFVVAEMIRLLRQLATAADEEIEAPRQQGYRELNPGALENYKAQDGLNYPFPPSGVKVNRKI